MNLTKIVKADFDSPCPELSNGGLSLKNVVALSVFLAIDFLCLFWKSNKSSCISDYVLLWNKVTF